MSAGTAVNAQRQLQSTLRSDAPGAAPVPKKRVNHLKQLHDAAVKRSDALSKKVVGGLTNKKELTSEELVEYRLRDSSEQVARQIAFQAHQQMDTLLDVQQRVDGAMKKSAALFEEEEHDASADPEDMLKGHEWVENSRRKINGQIFRFNESCDERQEQLEDFCDWFELYENMWPLPLVTTNIQYDELQGTSSVDAMQDHVSEMEKLWPKMGMMREDLSKLMAQAAEMGRRALSAELKAQIQNLTRKLNASEELAEHLQRSLDAEKNTSRELRNEVAKTKQVAEVQMARKVEEIKALNDQLAKQQENSRKQVEEMRAMYAEREDKLKETIKNLKEATKAEMDALKAQISELTQTNAALEENVAGLKADIVEREQHIDRLRETVRTLEGRLEATKKELEQAKEDLRIEKEEAKKREAKYLKTIEEQKRLIKKREDEIKQQAIIIAEKQAKIEEQQQEINELKMAVKKLEKELEKVKKELDEAKKKISELEKRVTSLKAACEKLKVELKEKEAEIKELKDAAEKYVQQIAELETRVTTLEQDLANTKEELKQRITEHENDKATWAAEKQAFEEHVQQLKDEGEGLRSDLKAKGIALEELEQAKQKMMEDYEQTIAQQTEAFEARISSLETERDELQQYKDEQESKTFEDAETEVDNGWFVENAQSQMSTSTHNRSTSVTPATTGSGGGGRGAGEKGEGGLLTGEQAQRVISKFKLLREKLYFMRVGFERDSTEFRSVIKESLEKKAAVQKELDLDVTLLRAKVEQMFEMAEAKRVAIDNVESDAANSLVLDLCDESICLLEHVSSATQEAPTRLACELVLSLESAETEGNEDKLKQEIASDIARACGGPLEKIKVRSLRESPVIADLILCQGLDPGGKSTTEIFKMLKGQMANPESLLMIGHATCKTTDLRLKQAYSQKEPRKSSNSKLLQGVPRTLLEVEQVLEGIEGALADPATLATDPTMYAPDQERPSSAVVAQLRPLLSVARMPMGAELAEPNFDFSMMSKLHNKWRKAEHQAQEGFLERGPQQVPEIPQQESSPPGSPVSKRKQNWKVEVPSVPSSPLAAAKAGTTPLAAAKAGSTPLAAMKTQGSKRELIEARKAVAQQGSFSGSFSASVSAGAPSQEERNASFLQWRNSNVPQDLAQRRSVTFGSYKNSPQREQANAFGSSRFTSQREQARDPRADQGRNSSLEMLAEDGQAAPGVPGSALPELDPAAARKAMLNAAMYNRQQLDLGDVQPGNLEFQMSVKSAGARSPMPIGSSARLQLPQATRVNPTKSAKNMVDFGGLMGQSFRGKLPAQSRGQQENDDDEMLLSMEDPSQYVPGTSHMHDAVPEDAAAQFHARIRTPPAVEVQGPPLKRGVSNTVVAASKPVSRPITVSRRIDAAELHELSEMNRSDEERLPELIEVYDLQRGGLVGRSSFKAKARPTSVDEMQLEQLRNEMREQAAYDEGFKPTGVVPDFGDSPYRSQYVQMGPPVAGLHSMGSFSVKARPQAAKMSSFRQAKNASLISARSPADFEPWVDMEQSFDTSATAPSYRPSKVIRSLETVKYRDSKRRSASVNPRLNALEVSVGQDLSTSMMLHDMDIVNLSNSREEAGESENVPDPLLLFNDNAE